MTQYKQKSTKYHFNYHFPGKIGVAICPLDFSNPKLFLLSNIILFQFYLT